MPSVASAPPWPWSPRRRGWWIGSPTGSDLRPPGSRLRIRGGSRSVSAVRVRRWGDRPAKETPMIQDLIAAERRELAALLDELPPSAWATPTLCAGWRVPEVVAHMTMPFRFSTGRFVRELLKSGGRFDAMADRVARREAAELSHEDLVASLRDNADHPWRP